MIFVSVGTNSEKPFSRLIKKMDEIAGKIDEKVIMQIAESEYIPVNSEYYRYLPFDRVIKYLKAARVYVCHAGTGSIIVGLSNGVPTIVVPRDKKFNELPDDHQQKTALAFGKEDLVWIAYTLDDLESLVLDRNLNVKKVKIQKTLLINRLKNYLKSIK